MPITFRAVSTTYDFAAETLRTLIPAMEEFGIATAEKVGVDILADRLRKLAIAGDHCIFFRWLSVPGQPLDLTAA